MRKKLVLLTDGFPYGIGEKPFISPEIDALHNKFDLTIVSIAKRKWLNDLEHISPLPSNVNVVWCGKKKLFAILAGIIRMPFTLEGRIEIKDIWRESSSISTKLLRTLTSTLYYGLAENIRVQMQDASLFDAIEDTLYYSFWFGRCAMALALEKKRDADLTFISRTHRYELFNHCAPFSRQPFQWFKNEQCAAVAFISQYCMEYFITTYDKERIHLKDYYLFRLGSITPGQAPDPSKSDPKIIVSCSHVIPRKRVNLIAQSLLDLNREDIVWVHFGDGPELQTVKSIVDNCVSECVFYGHVDSKAIQEFYSKNYVSCFITTSASEGCPVSVMEAMAYGVPVIGTNIDGIPEEIDGNGILLADNPTISEICNAITEIVDMPREEYLALRNRSLELFEERFNLTKNLKSFVAFLKQF